MSQDRERPGRGPLHKEALIALREAAAAAILEHERHGLPLVYWQDGKIVELSAQEAKVAYRKSWEAAKAAGDDAIPAECPFPAPELPPGSDSEGVGC